MGQEIRKETDWFGREKDVIYENGTKVGETRHETNFWGTPIDRTYNSEGEQVSNTKHETNFWGTPIDRTYNTECERVSETRHEEGFFGGKKQVLHEFVEKIDLTRRVARKESNQTSKNYSPNNFEQTEQTNFQQESRSHFSSEFEQTEQTNYSQEESKLERNVQMPRYIVSKYTPERTIDDLLKTRGFKQEIRIHFQPTIYETRYKCDRCGHEYSAIHDDYKDIPEYAKCVMGCNNWDNNYSFSGLLNKLIIYLFTGKPIGSSHAKLISQKEC